MQTTLAAYPNVTSAVLDARNNQVGSRRAERPQHWAGAGLLIDLEPPYAESEEGVTSSFRSDAQRLAERR